MDTAFLHFINDTIKNPLLDSFFPLFANENAVVIPGIIAFLAALIYGRRRMRTALLATLLGLALANTGSEKVIKNAVERDRPYLTVDGLHVYWDGTWHDASPLWRLTFTKRSNSFPSSHAANAAALATGLASLHPATLLVTVPFAVLVGISRVYLGHHYPVDVLAGFAWGFIATLAMLALVRWLARRCWGPPLPEPPRAPLPVERRLFLWLLLGWTVFNYLFILLNLYNLAGDEAQYWDWSRHLELGYYSKPPMIAYVIWLMTRLAGNAEWAIRSGAVLCSSGSLALIYALTRRITQSERAALIAVVMLLAMPLSWAGSILMTIDPVLALFWLLATYAAWRAFEGERGWWLVLGLALGGGMLTKYTILFLVVPLAIYLLFWQRRWLRTPWPYAALAISMACSAGVLYWNSANGWVSVKHTASIGAGEDPSLGNALGQFGEYLGSQLGVVSPILFVFLLVAVGWALRRILTGRGAAFLVLPFVSLFGSYALISFFRSPEANWPACAYLTAAPLFGYWWVQRARGVWVRRIWITGLILGIAIGALARSTEMLYQIGTNLPAQLDPTNRLQGGRQIGDALSKYRFSPSGEAFVFSDHYQRTAWAAYYTLGRPHAYCWYTRDRRLNQYDLWGGWEKLVGRDGLLVTGGNPFRANFLVAQMVQLGAFESSEFLEEVKVKRGDVTVDTYRIYRLKHFSGVVIEPENPDY